MQPIACTTALLRLGARDASHRSRTANLTLSKRPAGSPVPRWASLSPRSLLVLIAAALVLRQLFRSCRWSAPEFVPQQDEGIMFDAHEHAHRLEPRNTPTRRCAMPKTTLKTIDRRRQHPHDRRHAATKVSNYRARAASCLKRQGHETRSTDAEADRRATIRERLANMAGIKPDGAGPEPIVRLRSPSSAPENGRASPKISEDLMSAAREDSRHRRSGKQ